MLRTLVDEGLVLCDGPRWHDGRLWFSDLYGGGVHTVDLDGNVERVLDLPQGPSGLGFLDDGSWLVVSQCDQRVLRIADERSTFADVSGVAVSNLNDMVIDEAGRVYLSCFGFDPAAGEEFAPAPLIMVDTDGTSRVVAEGLAFPNALVLTPDGSTLLVSQTMASSIEAFTVAPDGSLTDRRAWADLGERNPDGMCLDADGAVWVACVYTSEVLRVAEGGEILDRIETPGRWATACMLGGPGRRHLFVLTSETDLERIGRNEGHGRVEVTEVAVPGAGRP